jgi:phage baseplate assembly protein W
MATTDNNSFLGAGWHFPPTFGGEGVSVEMVSNEDDVLESIQILISTSLGERIMHPIFGCNLQDYLFDEINYKMRTGIKSMITDSILEYETRVNLNDVTVDQDQDNLGLLHVGIDYTIKSTNSRKNLVFPFYIKEADEG